MTISILMSTYNGEGYLISQLDSIRNQTRPADEVIICDDCSTDRTVDIIKEYISNYDLINWKLFVNEKNKGWKKNFIDGITKTSGDIIMFSDQDDVWLRDKVEIMEKEFAKNRRMSVIATGEVLWDGKEEGNFRSNIKKESSIEFYDKGNNFLIHCSGCTMGIKRDFYNLIIPYYSDEWAHDDFFWKMGIATNCLMLLEGATILHRIHGNNESQKKRDRAGTIEGLLIDRVVCNKLLEFLNSGLVNNYSLKKNIEAVMQRKKYSELRLQLVQNKKYLTALELLPYIGLYRRKRQYIGDILLAFNFKIH